MSTGGSPAFFTAIFVFSGLLVLLRTISLHSSLKLYLPDRPNGAAICAISKWTLRYIDEWVDYHLALGFEKIYVYDNSDEFELQDWQRNRLNDSGRIQVVHYPGELKQMSAYEECGTSIRDNKLHRWIAFIDLDEFLVIRNTEKYPRIMDFLYNAPLHVGGVAINWQNFHYNNQTKYEPKPVTLRFQRVAKMNPLVKIIVRADVFKKHNSPHKIIYTNKAMHTVDPTFSYKVKRTRNYKMPNDVLVLNHYYTKSIEEFKERCKRGRTDLSRLETENRKDKFCNENIVSAFMNESNITDDSAWKLLKERVPKYAHFST